MPRTTASYVLLCLISAGLLCSPIISYSAQQPITESAKVAPQKPKVTTTKPTSAKAATATPAKPTVAVTAKVADKPGKRFWSRIMSCFRDVHSVEKKTNK